MGYTVSSKRDGTDDAKGFLRKPLTRSLTGKAYRWCGFDSCNPVQISRNIINGECV